MILIALAANGGKNEASQGKPGTVRHHYLLKTIAAVAVSVG